MTWLERALCAQTDPETFFPSVGQSHAAARAVCAACPVTAECLELWRSLPFDQAAHGVWAGMSGYQLARPSRARTCEACGLVPIPAGPTRYCGDCAPVAARERNRRPADGPADHESGAAS